MFVELALCFVATAAVDAVYNGPLAGGLPAHQFPAGVSPQACPNYPNCNNPAVAANPNAPIPYNAYNPVPQQYNPVPQYNPPTPYNAPPVPQYTPNLQTALDRGEYIGDGDYHGEGLAESGAYGAYNGNYNPAPAYNPGAYNPAAPPAGLGQIPAGVDARSCPNYPFCH